MDIREANERILDKGVWKQFIPDSETHGSYITCGDKYGSPGDSFQLNLTGPYRGKWRDWATGEHGDLVDLVQERMGFSSPTKVIEWLGGTPAIPRNKVSVAQHDREVEQIRASKIKYAENLWDSAEDGKEMEFHYLDGRTLNNEKMVRRWSRKAHGFTEVRWLPGHMTESHRQLEEDKQPHGAILYPVRSITGGFVGIQRIFMRRDEHGNWYPYYDGVRKAALGCVGGGFVGVHSPKSANMDLVISEGIENGYCWAHIVKYKMRVYSALSTGGMIALSRVMPIAEGRRYIFAVDGDEPGVSAGHQAMEILRLRESDVRTKMVYFEELDALDVLRNKCVSDEPIPEIKEINCG